MLHYNPPCCDPMNWSISGIILKAGKGRRSKTGSLNSISGIMTDNVMSALCVASKCYQAPRFQFRFFFNVCSGNFCCPSFYPSHSSLYLNFKSCTKLSKAPPYSICLLSCKVRWTKFFFFLFSFNLYSLVAVC
uniref:Uncharacterized protein n=1 Tax=Opuntia streptacantha TaxID=393608 RepID=A0A7C9CHV5_OPUST